jgi:hypothetical protein
MRTLEELIANPLSSLIGDELDNVDAMPVSGRTDGRPHSDYQYDVDSGWELPGSRFKCVIEASKGDKPYELRRRAADIRWREFRTRFDKIWRKPGWMDRVLGIPPESRKARDAALAAEVVHGNAEFSITEAVDDIIENNKWDEYLGIPLGAKPRSYYDALLAKGMTAEEIKALDEAQAES